MADAENLLNVPQHGAVPPSHVRRQIYDAAKALEDFAGGSRSLFAYCARVVDNWTSKSGLPSCSDIHIKVAYYFRHSGQLERALQFTVLATEINPTGFTYRDLGIMRTERAAAHLDQIKTKYGSCAEAIKMLQWGYKAFYLSDEHGEAPSQISLVENPWDYINKTRERYERDCEPYK